MRLRIEYITVAVLVCEIVVLWLALLCDWNHLTTLYACEIALCVGGALGMAWSSVDKE